MGFRLPSIRRASFSGSQASLNVPKGYLAIYVGEKMKRFVIPIVLESTFISRFAESAEEEFGYDHPAGGLTIPCTEDVFLHIISCFSRL